MPPKYPNRHVVPRTGLYQLEKCTTYYCLRCKRTNYEGSRHVCPDQRLQNEVVEAWIA
jgi:hypothetical protein